MTRPTRFSWPFPQGVGIPGGDPALPPGQPPLDCCDDEAEVPDRALDTTPFIGVEGGAGDLLQDKESTYNGAGTALAFDTDPEVGNLLVAAMEYRSGSTPGLTDWEQVDVIGAAGRSAVMWWRLAPGGPVSVFPSGNTSERRLSIAEYDSPAELEDQAPDGGTWPGPGGAGTGTFTTGDVVLGDAGILVGLIVTGDPGGGGHTNYTEDPDFVNVDEGSVSGGLTPEYNVGYRVVTSGTWDYAPTGVTTAGGHPSWAGLLAAFGTGDTWVGAGPEMTDGDDSTCTEVTGPNVARLWLGDAFAIARVRLVIGTEFAGAKTYVLKGANLSDFSDAVTVATLNFMATGSFTDDVVTASWTVTDEYEFWELTGTDETRNVCSFELYEATTSVDTTAIEADIDALEAATDPVTGLFVTKIDGGLETLEAHGAAGATETLDLGDGNWHSLTLDADCTITVTGFTTAMGCSAIVKVTQDGTGGWAITWDSDIIFAGDDQPDQTPDSVSWFILASDEGDGTIYGFPVGGSGGSSVTYGTPAIALGTVADAGSTDESIRRDATIVAFDATVPVTQTFGDAAATGSADVAARRDHVHGMPTSAGVGAILIADDHSTPLVFADLIQTEAGDDLVYADPV